MTAPDQPAPDQPMPGQLVPDQLVLGGGAGAPVARAEAARRLTAEHGVDSADISDAGVAGWPSMPEWMRARAAETAREWAEGTAAPAPWDDPAEIRARIAELRARAHATAGSADHAGAGSRADSGGDGGALPGPEAQLGGWSAAAAGPGDVDRSPGAAAERWERRVADPDTRVAVAAAVDRCGSGADRGPAHAADIDRTGRQDAADADADADAAGGDEAGWYR